ncbi:hypothetical protein [Streptomyces celluloflavus]|uniref:hypothetical protein n=1 Tax=Streptomyces celluloflavus TaxID=58344 RepID=UPI00367AED56
MHASLDQGEAPVDCGDRGQPLWLFSEWDKGQVVIVTGSSGCSTPPPPLSGLRAVAGAEGVWHGIPSVVDETAVEIEAEIGSILIDQPWFHRCFMATAV